MSTITQNNSWLELVADVSRPYFNREQDVSALLVGILSELNVVMIGPPGTAKSAIANALLERLPTPTFKAQLNPYSDPEQILGPLSLKALREKDCRERMTAGYLPEATYAVLDEIFKATGSTLVALLQILNERKLAEEGRMIECPLKSVIGASNERPDEESNALADRFALWIPFHYTQDRTAMLKHTLQFGSISSDEKPTPKRVSMLDIKKFKSRVDTILKNNKDEIVQTVIAFDVAVQKLAGRLANDAKLSDRALIQCMRLMATSCALRNGEKVDSCDAWVFKYLARAEEFVPFYHQALESVMELNQTLKILMENLAQKTLSRQERVLVANSFKDLPFSWQVQLQSKMNIDD